MFRRYTAIVFFRSRRGRLFGVSASFRFRACRHSTRASGLVTSSWQRCRLFGAERDAAASSLRDARHACASSARPRARARARADTRARGPRKLPQVRRVRRPPRRSRVPSPPLPSVALRRARSLRCVSGRDARGTFDARTPPATAWKRPRRPEATRHRSRPVVGRHTLGRLETMFTTDVLLPCRLP